MLGAVVNSSDLEHGHHLFTARGTSNSLCVCLALMARPVVAKPDVGRFIEWAHGKISLLYQRKKVQYLRIVNHPSPMIVDQSDLPTSCRE
jgi:hypothetical protein